MKLSNNNIKNISCASCLHCQNCSFSELICRRIRMNKCKSFLKNTRKSYDNRENEQNTHTER